MQVELLKKTLYRFESSAKVSIREESIIFIKYKVL